MTSAPAASKLKAVGERHFACQDPNRMERIPMTAEGYKSLEHEVNELKSVERPSIIKMIAEARAHGDLSENAEYHAAKERQAFVEGRVIELEALGLYREVWRHGDDGGRRLQSEAQVPDRGRPRGRRHQGPHLHLLA